MNGELLCNAKYKEQSVTGLKYVVSGNKPALLCRDWLAHIRLDWPGIGASLHVNSLKSVKDKAEEWKAKFPKLFENSLGKSKGYKANIKISQMPFPSFVKLQSCPMQ